MPLITCRLQSGFGNRLFQYAAARSYAEHHGCDLQVTGDYWLREAFGLETPQIDRDLPDALDYLHADWDGKTDIRFTGTFIHQRHILYTRSQVREWFKLRPEVLELLSAIPTFGLAAHLRWGDYIARDGFIALSRECYEQAMTQAGYDARCAHWITEDAPIIVPGIPAGIPWGQRKEDNPPGIWFIPDFYAMMKAEVFFRGPSTFSWWAATLGDNQRVFSPDQAGLPHLGGNRGFQSCPFVEGNHVRISHWWDACTDLHLEP